jgi:hypothetical protein
MGWLVNFYHHHVSLVHKAGYTALGLGVGTAAVLFGQPTIPNDSSPGPGLPSIHLVGFVNTSKLLYIVLQLGYIAQGR